jgi:hypothetical protein
MFLFRLETMLQSLRAIGIILIDVEVILKRFNKVPPNNPKALCY